MATAALVKIPSVTSAQIINNTSVPLKSGTLTLNEPLASTSTDAKLFLTISDEENKPFTIPLFPDAFVGSKGGLGQIWRFEMAEKELGVVEVTFPESVDENLSLQFEQVLVYYGFLKTGLVGDADDFSRTLLERAATFSSKITTKTDNRNAAAAPAETDTEFSNVTKSIVGGAQSGTSKAAQVTSDLGSVVSGAVYDAGAWIGRTTGLKSTTASEDEPTPADEKSLARETMDQTLEAGEIAARGVGAGIVKVGSTVGESASKIAEHDHGSKAKDLVDTTRQTGANVGQVAIDAFTGTSVVWHAGTAGVGATKAAQEAEFEEQDVEGETKEENEEEDSKQEDLKTISPKPI